MNPRTGLLFLEPSSAPRPTEPDRRLSIHLRVLVCAATLWFHPETTEAGNPDTNDSRAVSSMTSPMMSKAAQAGIPVEEAGLVEAATFDPSGDVEGLENDDASENAPENAVENVSAAEESRRSFYVESLGYGTRQESEPPGYVRELADIDWLGRPGQNWLDLGLDYRMRYEIRDDDLRRPLVNSHDQPFLLRSRAFLGVKEAFDPFRFAVEFEDASLENSQFEPNSRDVNRNEIIQMYGELLFDSVPLVDRRLRVQAGQMAFEAVDRRLIARNDWRNTTNHFRGIRAAIGERSDDWQLDLFALNPMILDPFEEDQADEGTGFYGLIGDWRRWSDVMTIQPYYFVLDRHRGEFTPDREIHTLATRGYGIVGDSGWDYDFDFAFQFGQDSDQRHRAFAFTTEVGHSFDRPLKPRLSGFIGYASGDRDPNDDVSQRFDRLFGFGRPWSASDYFIWQNVIAPKTRLEFRPHPKWQVDCGYGAYWLASRTDVWALTGLRDPTGQSGNFLGQELDFRVRWAATSRTDITLGYAHFFAGGFTERSGRPEDTDFFYVETLVSLFK